MWPNSSRMRMSSSSSYPSITSEVGSRWLLNFTCSHRQVLPETIMDRNFQGVMLRHWPMPRDITMAASGTHGLGYIDVPPGSASPAVRACQPPWSFSMVPMWFPTLPKIFEFQYRLHGLELAKVMAVVMLLPWCQPAGKLTFLFERAP